MTQFLDWTERHLTLGIRSGLDIAANGAAFQLRRSGRKRSFICVILGGVPTVLVSGPYRMYFYSHEPNEPPHVHIDRDDSSAKFWLDPVALAANLGFAPPELRRIQRLVVENRALLLERWHERFPS